MPSFKKEKIAIQKLSDRAEVIPKEIQARRTAAEETYQNVLNRLGAKGTYETVGGTPTSGATTDSGAGIDAGSKGGILKKQLIGKGAFEDLSATTLDPKKAADSAVDSAQGRIVSRMTAESEQLLAREGPLYDEMLRNRQLPIIEGSAQIARQNAEALKRMAARGGSARRQAFEAVSQIRENERINSARMTALSQTRTELDNWSRDYAKSTVEFGQNWASNLGGVRETYQRAMDGASELMLTSAIPLAIGSVKDIANMRAQVHAQKRAKTAKWINGIIGVGAMFLGGAGAGLLGAGLQKAVGGELGSVAKGAGPLTAAGAGMVGESLGISGE